MSPESLAVGGQLKGTFALGRGREAFLSHHLGDLDHYEAYRAFEKDVALYEQLFAVAPQVIAHDLHLAYMTSRYAGQRAAQMGARLLAVLHHHAHLTSCVAEHGLAGPVLGVTFDGTGYGTDGAIWGGEFLVGDYNDFQRAAQLRYVGLPGGDRAVREPWRVVVANLIDAQVGLSALKARLLPAELRPVERMLERGLNKPPMLSAGRLFDAVAVELEWLADGIAPDGAYSFTLERPPEVWGGGPLVVDTRSIIRAVAEDARKGVGGALVARRFHSTLVEIIAAVCERLRCETGLAEVVLSGGVFLNALRTREVCDRQ